MILLIGAGGTAWGGKRTPRMPEVPQSLDAQKVICWTGDGDSERPTGDLEEFLVDRLGASGQRIAVEPGTTHAILRLLGLQNRSVFDPAAAQRLAEAAGARWVLWVKVVDRNLQSKKLLSFPYLFNHRRLDAHIFFDTRLYDADLQTLLGSKRLKLSDKGEGTWQVTEDERLDPIYNNDPVEIHNRFRKLDWQAAALISGYCADLLRPERLSLMERSVRLRAEAAKAVVPRKHDPAVVKANLPD